MTVEAVAMRDGLALANVTGVSRIEAESDSLTMVNYCQGQNQWWDAAVAIFAECIDLATLIGKITFKLCFHDANCST